MILYKNKNQNIIKEKYNHFKLKMMTKFKNKLRIKMLIKNYYKKRRSIKQMHNFKNLNY